MKNFVTTIFFICFMALPPACAAPQRIVSFSPVGTEILFALGQKERIAAVTDFCDYPPEALKKRKVGGFASINYEMLILMKADLVVLQDMHSQLVPQLKSLKIPYVILKQESIEGICKSITELGRICGSEAIAERMVKNILSEVGSLRAKVKGKARPSVMVCVSRELSEPVISTIYIAGQNNFYNELIDIAGGVNVSKERRIAYPQVSPDGISKMNPNIIIDLVGDKSYYHSKDKIDLETIFSTKYLKNQWMRSVSADAVKRGRIAVMNGTVYLRPGPRVGEVLRSFAEAIHPEIKR